MTYDENEDYNGPDVHRRGPFLFMAAIVGVIVMAGFGAAVSDARADPSQTVLPADGVVSVTRAGDTWSVTTDGIPSEVKLLSPRNEVLCGVNYGVPCTTVTTFTSTGDCQMLQFDGIPGHNSSDPIFCSGGTPSATPTPPAPTPDPTGTPIPLPSTLPTSTATPSPFPSPSPTSSPTSTPEPSSPPSTPPASAPVSPSLPTSPSTPPSVSTATPVPTAGLSEATPAAPARLADTGTTDKWPLTIVMAFTLVLGLGALVITRRAS
jgi:hypothetical protein